MRLLLLHRHLPKLILGATAGLALTVITPILAATTRVALAEYKQTDTTDYLAADVLKADPHALIVPSETVKHNGDSYYLPARKKPPAQIYLQQIHEWMEPITPPDMPANLNIPLDEMQVREPHGDVEVALPSAPGTFNPATEGMILPSGAFSGRVSMAAWRCFSAESTPCVLARVPKAQ